jgi:hypothetical protein
VPRLWACVVESSCGDKVVASGDGCSFLAVQTGGRKYICTMVVLWGLGLE